MSKASLDLLKGTLDVLILKTVSWQPLHGYGISLAIRSATEQAFQVEEGALYPALRRLEKKGLLEASWGLTATGREAKFYQLTRLGSRTLASDVESWGRYVEAMSRVLFASGPLGEEGA
jgi:PadR family transcriptional regulator PadR